jgi:hypothetical protein
MRSRNREQRPYAWRHRMPRRTSQLKGAVALGLLAAVVAGGTAAAAQQPGGHLRPRTVADARSHSGPGDIRHNYGMPGTLVKYYVVPPAENGAVETLPDIANRTLGDADRARDILRLTRSRRQPDGGRMVDDDVRPGWRLLLPAEANRDRVKVGLVPAGAAVAGPPVAEERASSPFAALGVLGFAVLAGGLLLALGFGFWLRGMLLHRRERVNRNSWAHPETIQIAAPTVI